MLASRRLLLVPSVSKLGDARWSNDACIFIVKPHVRHVRNTPPKAIATTANTRYVSNISRAKPAIAELVNNFDVLPKHTLPPSLASKLSVFAAREVASAASGAPPREEEYESIKLECSTFINDFYRSQMGGKKTGDAVYSQQALDTYDTFVWQFNAPFLWRISESECQSLYENNIHSVHCEVAVGTGLFLKNVSPDRKPRELALLDLNENSLAVCGERVSRAAREEGAFLKLNKAIADITRIETIPPGMRGKYQSVAANFLLHCLHGGSLLDKKAAIEGCAALLSPTDEDACFFGTTILGGEIMSDTVEAGETTVQTIESYNECGIFGNRGDVFEDLEKVLRDCFEDVEVWRSGYCGLWKARKPIYK